MSYDDNEDDNENFVLFCRNATNSQLEEILRKEWLASQTDESRAADYYAARYVAGQRGWDVRRGERIG